MRAFLVTICCLVAAVLGLSAQVRTGTLTIYYIDTEGGQSTLFVGPTGESLLVDTGNAGERDLGRIVETLRSAGVTKIDHLWTTHYHGDHAANANAFAGSTWIVQEPQRAAMFSDPRRNEARRSDMPKSAGAYVFVGPNP